MKIKRAFLILLLLFFYCGFLYPQSQKIIIKLKSNTPTEILDNFKSNTLKSGNSSLAKLAGELSLSNSKQLLIKSLGKVNSKDLNEFGLDKIYIVEVNSQLVKNAVKLLGKNQYIEYSQEVGKYILNNDVKNSYIPNDPLYSSQYYLQSIGIEQVWDITTGDSTIIIGVVDSGLDFLHPDLQNSFKINYNEINQNNFDDDNNGYIDDWRGWNFVNNTNDPTDDNNLSHGTSVTGIINASINNGVGISSIAPKCKVLVLKAFDSQGLGYEDNIANAILYGVTYGVKIFNFSFGDYQYSNLLRDIIRYAYSKNITIICSAGNDASDRMHYPSAFDEVISVGASDELNRKASFSSFGETVDIYAPGSGIVTTSRIGQGESIYNNDYHHSNGTSFSAPIVVGFAALLLTKNNILTNEEIRGILVSTTNYFDGQSDWNHNYSSGLLNGINAINNSNNPSIARIFSPYQDFSTDTLKVPVIISAASQLFKSFSVSYGMGENPINFITFVNDQNNQVLNQQVGLLDFNNFQDTSYTLKLAVKTAPGKTIEHRMIIHKDSKLPVVMSYSSGEIIENNIYSQLVYFYTDKATLGKIYYKRKNISEPYSFIYADAGYGNIGYVSNEHFGLLRSNALSIGAEYEYYAEAVSTNGKSVILTDTAFHFSAKNEINKYGFIKKSYTLPASQFSSAITDINSNLKKDFFTNSVTDNLRLNVYEFNNNSFTKISNNNWQDYTIVKDVTDLSGINKYSILTSTGRNGRVYEAPLPNQLPVNLIWSDVLNDNFWSSRFADSDGDGKKEIMGFGQNGLRILEYNNGNFVETALLNYAKPNSQANSQTVLVDDFDNDGKKEIVFIDTYFPDPSSSNQDLNLNIYKNISDNTYSKVQTETFTRFLKSDNLISGDFDGDGIKEFALGTISNPSETVQYYSLLVFKYLSGSYKLTGNVDIFMQKPNAEVSTKAGDIDNDGKDEITVNTSNNFYIIKYINNKYEAVLYQKDINSTNQIIYDFDNNGIKEIGINTIQDSLIFIEKDLPFTGPQTPRDFTAFSLDSNKVQLNFSPVPGADYYKIYRADNDTLMNFVLYDSTLTTFYNDLNVVNRENYLYKITSVDSNLSIKESKVTEFIRVYIHNKSYLVKANSENNGYVNLKFSEKINNSIPEMSSFIFSNGLGNPKNIAIKNSYEYLISFGNKIPSGSYNVHTETLKDYFGSPVDTNSVSFVVTNTDTLLFYIRSVSLLDRERLKVEFNLDVDTVSIRNVNNFSLEPVGLNVISVDIEKSSRNIIYLTINLKGGIGSSGKIYTLRANNIFSNSGVKISSGAGSYFSLSFAKENLNSVAVYPNPYSKKYNQNYITFANLTKNAKVTIYDLTGKYIAEIIEKDANGGVEWDLKTSTGEEVPTGIYIFRAEGKDSNGNDVTEKMGKFLIVR